MSTPFEQLSRGKQFLNKQIGDKFVNYFENQGQLGIADFLDPTKDRDKKGGVVKKDSTGKYFYDASKPGTTMPIGSFSQNVAQLRTTNGTTDSNGMPSVGDQELAQKENENEKTSILQKVTNFLTSPFTKTFGTEEQPKFDGQDGVLYNGKYVHPSFYKLIMEREDLKQKYDTTGSIYD